MGRKPLMDYLTSAADLASEPIPGRPLIELAGDRTVLIENHKGVSEYSNMTIGINVKFGKVLVCGSALELIQMSKDRLIISGQIDKVELMRDMSHGDH